MFGKHSSDPFPDEINHSHSAWNKYMGTVWEALLKKTSALTQNTIPTIIEVAPGQSNKIAIALGQLKYRDKVIIIDPDPQSTQKSAQNYAQYCPNVEITTYTQSLESAAKHITKNSIGPCMIVSNHPLDDMILGNIAKEKNIRNLFDWSAKDGAQTPKSIHELWKSAEEKINIYIRNAYMEWLNAISEIKPHVVILSQYNSYTLNECGLNELNTAGKSILQQLKHYLSPNIIDKSDIQNALNTCLNYNHPHIGYEILNAENWMIYINPLN